MELATLGLFAAMLLVCVVLEKSVLWALAAGFVLFRMAVRCEAA